MKFVLFNLIVFASLAFISDTHISPSSSTGPVEHVIYGSQ
jgi:hypothetical protein